jgi:hypothetical protein
MPQTYHDFTVELKEDLLIEVEYYFDAGQVIQFVVRLTLDEPHTRRTVARYDTAHGVAHLDILRASGRLQDKVWFPKLTFAECLENAIADFKTNYEKHLERYYSTEQ